jgi:hypothetical protein
MTKRRKGNWTGHILRRNCLLQHITEGKIDRKIEVLAEDDDVRSHWMILRTRQDTGN